MDRFEDLMSEEHFELEAHRADGQRDWADGQPYNRERIKDEILVYEEGMNPLKSYINFIGNRLILLRRNEGHEGFLKCLDVLGITRRRAAKMMYLANKSQGECHG